jgi:hypothetical protein
MLYIVVLPNTFLTPRTQHRNPSSATDGLHSPYTGYSFSLLNEKAVLLEVDKEKLSKREQE